MMMIGGKERSSKQFRDLCESVGLEVCKIWKSGTSYQCVVEAKLKST